MFLKSFNIWKVIRTTISEKELARKGITGQRDICRIIAKNRFLAVYMRIYVWYVHPEWNIKFTLPNIMDNLVIPKCVTSIYHILLFNILYECMNKSFSELLFLRNNNNRCLVWKCNTYKGKADTTNGKKYFELWLSISFINVFDMR